MIYDVCIAGGGASGMVAAITAARRGVNVLLLERLDSPGRKVLATGNGRCNLGNSRILRGSPDTGRGYRCSNPGFTEKVTASFDSEDAMVLFRSLGILTSARGEYIYPAAMQASVVREALLRAMRETGHVTVKTEAEVRNVEIPSGKCRYFRIRCEGDTEYCSLSLILACGGRSSPRLGSDGSGYRICRKLGHRIIPVVPALCALKCADYAVKINAGSRNGRSEGTSADIRKYDFFKNVAGVRTIASVTIYIDGVKTASDTGELQLTSYGISGIPVFQVSRYAAYGLLEKKQVEASVDFVPRMGYKDMNKLIEELSDFHPSYNMSEILSGIMNSKLSEAFTVISSRQMDIPCSGWSRRSVGRLTRIIKDFRVRVTDTNGFDNSQVSAGGVDTRQIDPLTMRSLIVDDLYIAGELLDADGICGGYNLHWAWATGYLAGRSAAAVTIKKHKKTHVN